MGALEEDIDAALREAGDLGRSLWRLRNRHADWSRRVFGRDSEVGPVGPMLHLQEEAREAAEAVNDPVEYADCLLLLLDGIRRAGLTLEQVIAAADGKMDVNEARRWPDPRDGSPRHHIGVAVAGAPSEMPAAWWAERLPICARCMLQDLSVRAAEWSPVPGGLIMRQQQIATLLSCGAVVANDGFTGPPVPQGFRLTGFGDRILEALDDRYRREIATVWPGDHSSAQGEVVRSDGEIATVDAGGVEVTGRRVPAMRRTGASGET